MRPARWVAWKCYQLSLWALTRSALWLSWEQGKDYVR